jgi:hypothetical protein
MSFSPARTDLAVKLLTSFSIAATFDLSELPIKRNVASLHVALVALASITEETIDHLKKTKSPLQTLARHKDIIIDTTQRRLNEAETSIKRLIKHEVLGNRRGYDGGYLSFAPHI